jgi:hypothetical protein
VIRPTLVTRRPALVALAAILVAVLSFGLWYSWFAPSSFEAQAYSINGKVSVQRGDITIPLTRDFSLERGDVIASEKNAWADLRMGEFMRIRVAGSSRLSLDRMSFGPDRSITVTVLNGYALFHVDKLRKGDAVSVETPVSTGIVRGTLFGVEYRQAGARYEVYEGAVRVNRKSGHMPGAAGAWAQADRDTAAGGVIVREGQYCAVSGLGRFEPASRGLAQGALRSRGSAMSASALDFMMEASKHERGLSLVPIAVDITPRDASLSVGGVVKTGDIIYVPRGSHRFNAAARGYAAKGGQLDVDRPMQKISLQLEQVKSPFMAWAAHLQAQHIFFNPVLAELVTVDDQCLIAATDFNEIKWTIDFDKKLSGTPYVDENMLYVATTDGMVAACDYNRGVMVWKRHLDSPVPGDRGMVRSGKNLFVVTDRAVLHKIDARGEIVWKKELPGPASARPAVRGDTIYLALGKGWLLGISGENGLEKRKAYFDDEIASMKISYDAIYISTLSGSVYNYSCGQDAIQWSFET